MAKGVTLARAAEILEQYAESIRSGCNNDGSATFDCEDCPAGRARCKREHREIVNAAKAVRAVDSRAVKP